ncbi:hypothetical protein Skr01_53890 [Sphaerisporangium krabiense]|nr:hypothetical protein Skr01_53890 [Sphaerisporangium krabiense]
MVIDIGAEPGRLDAIRGERGDERRERALGTGHERDPKPLPAEATSERQAEDRAGTEDRECSGHTEVSSFGRGLRKLTALST